MSDPEIPTQPLIRAPSLEAGDAGPPQRRSSTRPYKAAGIALLVCVLIVGQAMIAYFLLSQRNDIKSLEEKNKNLDAQLKTGSFGDTAMKIQVPMNSLSALTYDSAEKETSTGSPQKPAGGLRLVALSDEAV